MSSSSRDNLNTALAFRREGKPDAAVAHALKALAEDPALAEAWECAAFIYMSHRQWHPALELLQMAVSSVPNHPVLETYYALALAETGSLRVAYARIGEVLRRTPNHPQAIFAKAEILAAAGYYDLARDAYAAAGQNEDTRKSAGFGEAGARFMIGEFDRAMPGLAVLEDEASDVPHLPLWDGKRDAERGVVLYGSQGFGDTLMFLRYIKLAQASAKMTLRIPYQLAQLVHDSFPGLPLVASKDHGDMTALQLPEGVDFELAKDIEARCPLIRLSYIINGTFDPRGGEVPYLRADPAKVAVWEERLSALPHPRIGIVWAGSPRNGVDHRRSVPFNLLQPLVEQARPHLVSLQLGPEKERATPAGMFDASPYIRDFSDTAALMQTLDLVITVDTAAAHLAGALGRPVWNLMPFNPTDWRWMLGREDTIWYPTMRLFRQEKPGDWPGVIANVSDALKRLMAGDNNVLKPKVWSGPALQRQAEAVGLESL